jgi:hypothetical protein
MILVLGVWAFVRALLVNSAAVSLENVVLRHQLAQRSVGRPRSYLAYSNATRPHQSLHNNSPHPCNVQTPADGRIVAIPQVSGLHHCYQRAA